MAKMNWLFWNFSRWCGFMTFSFIITNGKGNVTMVTFFPLCLTFGINEHFVCFMFLPLKNLVKGYRHCHLEPLGHNTWSMFQHGFLIMKDSINLYYIFNKCNALAQRAKFQIEQNHPPPPPNHISSLFMSKISCPCKCTREKG